MPKTRCIERINSYTVIHTLPLTKSKYTLRQVRPCKLVMYFYTIIFSVNYSCRGLVMHDLSVLHWSLCMSVESEFGILCLRYLIL